MSKINWIAVSTAEREVIMIIRKFRVEDAKKVSDIIKETFLRVNIRSYSEIELEEILNQFHVEKITAITQFSHAYTLCSGKMIVGYGSVCKENRNKTSETIVTLFVSTCFLKQGAAEELLLQMEQDEYFKQAKQVKILSSLAACEFYQQISVKEKEKTA